jgi:ankyrin repeat protein
MNNLLILVLFAFYTLSASAQSNLKEIFESDDSIKLTEYLKSVEVDDCISLKKSDYNLLALSIKFDAKSIFRDLVFKHHADLDKACEDKSPLMYAAKYGRMDMVQTMLDKGADHNAKSSRGRTSYDYAIKYEHKSIADLLNGFMR